MRVLMLITDLQRGGTPLRVLRWAGWLPRIGVEPIVGCLAPRGPLSAELDARGIANFACDAAGPSDAFVLARLAGQVRCCDPDVIHSFLFHANLAARLAGRLDRRRPIITSTATIEIERGWHRQLERLTAGLSDRHVCNAPTVARHCVAALGFAPSRVVVIPNGLDLDAIDLTPAVNRTALALPESTRLLIWVGRMDPVKDLPTWIDVFDRLRQSAPVAGVWLGDGPQRSELIDILRRRDLCADTVSTEPCLPPRLTVGRIHLVGWQPWPIAWMKCADGLLLTSLTEGVPNVALEAMAAGCPVIATDVGGCRDWITPGRTGLLFRPRDARKAAAAIRNLWADRAAMQELRDQAREATRANQSREQVCTRLQSLYEECAASGL